MLHPNDKQNQRKHRKMNRRLQKGKVNQNCKWYRKNA
jgi:hypothetical protein